MQEAPVAETPYSLGGLFAARFLKWLPLMTSAESLPVVALYSRPRRTSGTEPRSRDWQEETLRLQDRSDTLTCDAQPCKRERVSECHGDTATRAHHSATATRVRHSAMARTHHGATVTRAYHGATVTRACHGATATRACHSATATRVHHGAMVTKAQHSHHCMPQRHSYRAEDHQSLTTVP